MDDGKNINLKKKNITKFKVWNNKSILDLKTHIGAFVYLVFDRSKKSFLKIKCCEHISYSIT